MANIAIRNKINRGAFSTLQEGDWTELMRRLTVVMEVLWEISEQTAGNQIVNQNITYYADDTPVDVTIPESEQPPDGRFSGTLYMTLPDGSTRECMIERGWIK